MAFDSGRNKIHTCFVRQVAQHFAQGHAYGECTTQASSLNRDWKVWGVFVEQVNLFAWNEELV